MDVQGKAGCLVRAIAGHDISQWVRQASEEFQELVTDLLTDFASSAPTPQGTLNLENSLHTLLRNLGQQLLQWLLSRLEPDTEQMPGTVKHQGRTYRRLAQKTQRTDVLTRFGKISLVRGRYRRGRSGRTIFPLEMLLGIQDGFTPAAADRIGQQFAQTGSSQGRTMAMIVDQMGAPIGTEKLRKLVGTLAGGMEPFREDAQVQKLVDLIDDAREQKQTPVLSVSRDGVALGLAPWSFFEMASVACVSVLADGHRLGTVYLGCVPEANQTTLSRQLTNLLKATFRRCGERVPEIIYVTDAGKIETAYWKNTLRRFFVDGARIKTTRVVDYYHAAERLTTIADALKFGKDKSKRTNWLEHVRGLLLEPGGHGRVLRSIARMRQAYGCKSSHAGEADKAEKYLRRYRRFMNYAAMKAHHFPIGSGVVESACKQIVSERMKLSGMRWHKQGAQRTLTLRCLLLSGIWDTVYKKWLESKPTVSDFIHEQTA